MLAQSPQSGFDLAFRSDGVTAVHSVGPAAELHRNRARHARAFEIAGCGSTQVVKKPSRSSCVATSGIPFVAQRGEQLAIAALSRLEQRVAGSGTKDPRRDDAGALEPFTLGGPTL
jgi:hypothetical protein